MIPKSVGAQVPYIKWQSIGLAKSSFVFFCKMALISLVFNFIQNNFVRLYCDSCHISVHLKKNLSKLVNFCVDILILKMEEKSNIFGILCFIISRKVKT